MNISKLRARPWGTALTFFAVGVLFASAMDWTPFSRAQGTTGSRQSMSSVKSMEESSNAFVSIAERVTPAVVAVQTHTNARTVQRGQNNPHGGVNPRDLPPELRNFQFFNGPQQVPSQEGTGSGFIISPDGYIVTNNHVVADADKITVAMTDHRTFEARLIGRDPQTDVAVIKIDAKNLPVISLGDDEKTRIGEWVLAIGNPLGLDFTVTAGIVSAKGRGSREVQLNNSPTSITDFIQTDAAINPGNSGGPLVNARGEVIGINTAIASGTGYYAGYGFAIPVDLAKTVWEDLIEHGTIVRAQLGINVQDVTAEDAQAAGLKDITGVEVAGCNPSPTTSPACKAGVQMGDVILSLDGRNVDRTSALQRIIRAKKPGDYVDVKAMRYGKPVDVRVKLNQMVDTSVVTASTDRKPKPSDNTLDRLGISVERVSDEFVKAANLPDRYRGLQVVDVDEDGGARGKFAEGDVIIGVMPNRDPIRTEDDLKRALSSKKAGDVVSLEVARTITAQGEKPQQQVVVVNLRVAR